MKILTLIFTAVLVALVSVGAGLPSSKSAGPDDHTEWIRRSLREIETVKVGMTRGDLLKVFTEEGGLSTRTWRRYVYRDCPNIKVDVEFEPMDEVENKLLQSPKDKIVKISKPYLEWSIED